VDENIHKIKSAGPGNSEQEAWLYERLSGALKIRHSPGICEKLLRRSMLTRVLAAIPPPDTRTVRAASGTWNPLAPGITVKLLRIDHDAGNMTAFIRMEPGSTFGAHQHTQSEECLVLEGEILIGAHRLNAGDMHVADAGTEHAMVTSPRGALMLVRSAHC
jgi:anti-sigma factor ChrR (cupin superfamily)